MADTTQTEPLYAALAQATAHAQAVAKDATNAFHRYKYASSEAVIEEARHALANAGLCVMPVGWRMQAGAGDAPAIVEVTYRLGHESGIVDSVIAWPVIPEKGRPFDKALAGALTTSLAYYLRALLLLPREEEDTAPDRRDDRNWIPPAPRSAQRPALPSQPPPALVEAVRATPVSAPLSVPSITDPPEQAAPSVSHDVDPTDEVAAQLVAKIKRAQSKQELDAAATEVQEAKLPDRSRALAKVRAAYSERRRAFNGAAS